MGTAFAISAGMRRTDPPFETTSRARPPALAQAESPNVVLLGPAPPPRSGFQHQIAHFLHTVRSWFIEGPIEPATDGGIGHPNNSAPRSGAEADQFFLAVSRERAPVSRFRRRLADAIDPERRERLRALLEDPLTGLPNAQAWARARDRLDANPRIELVTVDIIGLKAVNDTGGHEAGNRLIQLVGSVIARVADELQVERRQLFRFGGDEFVVAVPRGRGRAFARRLVHAVPSRPVADTGFLTGIRTGVGPTFHAADRAMTEARQREATPHYRDLQR